MDGPVGKFVLPVNPCTSHSMDSSRLSLCSDKSNHLMHTLLSFSAVWPPAFNSVCESHACYFALVHVGDEYLFSPH